MGQTPPRVTFKQLQKDTLTGSIAISGLDSNLTYSRDFYISADSFLILYGDTVGQGSLNAILVDGVTILGDGVSTNLSADTNLIKDIIGAMVNAGLGIDITYDPIDKELLIESLSVEDYVKNGTGLSIPKGTPLYFTGISGNFWEVAPADASDANKMPVVAIAGETIGAGDEGIALIKGHIKGVNTSAFTAGDEVYVAPGGGYTNVRPKGESNLVQFLGTVVKADANGSGIINLGEVEQNLNPGRIFIGGADSTITRVTLKDSISSVIGDSLASNVVRSITAGTFLSGGTITSSGTIALDTASAGLKTYISENGGGVTTDLTLTGNGTSGSELKVDTGVIATVSALADSLAGIISSVTTDLTLTGNGTVATPLKVDTAVIATLKALADSVATRGTVTSVSGTGTVNGISLSGTVTSTGNLTLGGTLSNVNLTSQVTGTLPVANGGTGVSSLTANKVLVGNGTDTVLTPTNLHWDNTNSRLGIGITAPRVALEVNADQIIDASNVWTARTSAADNNWFGVTYGNGLFVAVAATGSGDRVMTSPDGITWTARTSAADNDWRSVTYGNGLFVAVAVTGSGNRVMTSPDGITWTARTSAANNEWFSVTYGNGLFVAVAGSGSGNRVMTSPDGITWTARTSAADNSWLSVTYGNGLFVAVAVTGSGNRVMTSPDGITWTARTSAADNLWFSVTYGNGLFVAVARSGSGNRVMTSPDGITWTARTSAADNSWFGVTYGNGLFVAVAETGSGNRVMTSPDGITWTARTSAADNLWFSVTYGNGLFVAVARSGSGNRVMTSGKQYKQDLAHNNIWQGNQYMPFVYNQTTAEAANMYIDTTTGELKRSTSSIRYKTNVELYQKGLNDLLNLTPVTFKGINDGNKTFAGFIAEELDENGLTEFVQYDAQGKPDAIRYNQMVTILTKSIQELFAIIEELQVKIQILENKN
jgi:hypothetical protein